MSGIAATGTNLALLAILVEVVHLTPRLANVPSLLAGAIVNFIGNRKYAFHAETGNVHNQLRKFMIVEVGSFGLNTYLFDAALVFFPATATWYIPLRIVVSGAVYLGWSYPLWHRVFRAPGAQPAASSTDRQTAPDHMRVADGNPDPSQRQSKIRVEQADAIPGEQSHEQKQVGHPQA